MSELILKPFQDLSNHRTSTEFAIALLWKRVRNQQHDAPFEHIYQLVPDPFFKAPNIIREATKKERVKGLEPSTTTLATWCSTN
jgi:hypothetical protein